MSQKVAIANIYQILLSLAYLIVYFRVLYGVWTGEFVVTSSNLLFLLIDFPWIRLYTTNMNTPHLWIITVLSFSQFVIQFFLYLVFIISKRSFKEWFISAVDRYSEHIWEQLFVFHTNTKITALKSYCSIPSSHILFKILKNCHSYSSVMCFIRSTESQSSSTVLWLLPSLIAFWSFRNLIWGVFLSVAQLNSHGSFSFLCSCSS